jgi:hypothetical protein
MSFERNGFINRDMDDELLMVTPILIQHRSLKKGVLWNRFRGFVIGYNSES